MFCKVCGEQLQDNVRFCHSCGAPVQPQQANQVPPQFNQTPPQFNQQFNQQFDQQFNQQPMYMIEKKEIAIAIILTLITCGIYGLIWIAKLNDTLNGASNSDDMSGGTVVLLSLVTGGLFMIYWAYKAGEKLNVIKSMRGMQTDSNASILYLILCIFGLGIVAYALIQSELNKMATA